MLSEKIKKQKAEEQRKIFLSNALSTQAHLKRPQSVNIQAISLSQQIQISQSYKSKLTSQKPEIQNTLHFKPFTINTQEIINEQPQFVNRVKTQLQNHERQLTAQYGKKIEGTQSKKNNFISTSFVHKDDKRHSSLLDAMQFNAYSQVMNKFVPQPNNNLPFQDKQSRQSFSSQKTINQNIIPIRSIKLNNPENNTSHSSVINLKDIGSPVQEKLLDFNMNQILIPSIPERSTQQIFFSSQQKSKPQNFTEIQSLIQSPQASNQKKNYQQIQSPFQQIRQITPNSRKKDQFQQSKEKEDIQNTNLNQQISFLNQKDVDKKNIKKPYDLNSCLSLKVMSLTNYLQFKKEDQILPIMISVKADENFDINQDIKSIDSRPSLDLICVIDNSSSMRGRKIKNVQTALIELLELLTEKDRLSLVLFNEHASILCDLLKITPDNKFEMIQMINSISTQPSTNISLGMELAFSILAKRIQFNQITSIFLLSDGQDDNADQRINYYLTQGNGKNLFKKGEIFSIHTFGFGRDHDGPLMSRISKLRDGYFYYVENIDQVDQYFVNSLGGLLSVTAQEISISINLNKNNLRFMKFFKQAQITKTYGDMWKVVKKGESYNIEIAQLISGVSKDFIMEVTIPKTHQIQKLIDFERNFEVVKVSMTAIPLSNLEIATKIAIEKNLVLTLFSQNEIVAQISEINDEVELNYMRVKVAAVIEESMKFSEMQNYTKGQNLIDCMIQNINSLPNVESKMKLQSELNSLQISKEQCQPLKFENEGRLKMFTQTISLKDQSWNCKSDINRCSLRQTAMNAIFEERKKQSLR